MSHSERFERLAKCDQSELARLIKFDLADQPNQLTFSAEAVGLVADSALAVSILLPLLSHATPVVREGAVYGICPHLKSSTEALAVLREMASNDPSPGVRESAQDAMWVADSS